MKKYLIFCFSFLVMSSSLFALDVDQLAVLDKIDQLTTSWNEKQGVGFGDAYAKDADFINIFGTAFKGRDEIEARHVKILQTFMKDTLFTIDNLMLRKITPDTFIAHVYWSVSRKSNFVMKGVFTHILYNNEGEWEIVSSQNTAITN